MKRVQGTTAAATTLRGSTGGVHFLRSVERFSRPVIGWCRVGYSSNWAKTISLDSSCSRKHAVPSRACPARWFVSWALNAQR